MTRNLFVHTGREEPLWAEVIATAVYIDSRSPSKAVVDKMPHELWTEKKPTENHLKVFGASAINLNKKN